MALCSTFLPNGYWLACIGFAAWLSAVVLLVILFRLVAVGRLTGITAAMTWLLQRRWTAVAVLFGGAVALRATNGLGMVTLLTRILPHTTIMQVVQIKSLSNPVESLALLMIIVVGLTKAASSMRTSKCRT
jgi:hypothetical protein